MFTKLLILFLTLFLTSACAGFLPKQATLLPCSAADRPASVGFTEFQVTDPVTGALVPTALWYPSAAVAGKVVRGPFIMAVTEKGCLVTGLHPLVVISHGSGGSQFGHSDTALALAQQGYIVAAPLHPHDNFQDHRGAISWEVLTGRPRTVSAVIDYLFAAKTSGLQIDQAQVSMIGFSNGGYTALALVGAQPAMRHMNTHCRTYPQDSFCVRYNPNGQNPVSDKPMTGLTDRRIKSAVIMAPATAPFADDAFQAVTVPIRLYRAEHDEVLTEPWHAARVRKLLPVPPSYSTVMNAGHYAFLMPLPAERKADLGPLANDPPGFDRAAFHGQMNQEIVDFFKQVMVQSDQAMVH